MVPKAVVNLSEVVFDGSTKDTEIADNSGGLFFA